LSSFALDGRLGVDIYTLSVYNNALSAICQLPKDFMPNNANKAAKGLRERKRQETRQRIAETGLRLFLTNGYENTTLDTIAAEAGISRRTFFSHFKSKEDILFIWQSGAWNVVWDDLLTVSPDENPLDAVRDVFVKHISYYANDEMRSIDRLLRSSESLRARKQAAYEGQEQALFATLCEVWRQPQRRPALRMMAMACMGVVRLSLDVWSQQETADQSMADVLQEGFASLKLGIQ
jgi:AcrR family transcriptional regulator